MDDKLGEVILTWGIDKESGDDGEAWDPEWEWECLTNDLTEVMTTCSEDGHWHVDVNNFGWRNQSGHKDISVATGQQLLAAILPNTDCTFKIYRYGEDGLALQNWHHDSPMGNEWYYITPTTEGVEA